MGYTFLETLYHRNIMTRNEDRSNKVIQERIGSPGFLERVESILFTMERRHKLARRELDAIEKKIRIDQIKTEKIFNRDPIFKCFKRGGIFFFKVACLGGSFYIKKSDPAFEFDRAVFKTVGVLIGGIFLASIILKGF